MLKPERCATVCRGIDAPGDEERLSPVLQLAAEKLEQRLVDAAALLINSVNYGIGASRIANGGKCLAAEMLYSEAKSFSYGYELCARTL